MTFTEGIQTIVNTQNNNNIAWRNITRFSSGGGGVVRGPIGIYNTRSEATQIALRFNDPASDPVTTYTKVKFILGEVLYSKWRQGGSLGTNVEIAINEDGTLSNAVWINALPATLDGIRLDPDEQLTAEMEIVYPAVIDPRAAGRVYGLDLAQHDNGFDLPIGGEYYEIEMPRNVPPDIGVKTVVAGTRLASMLELAARPNPTSGATTISYMLPDDSRVTVSLYDVTGQLVRTLVAASVQKAGRHEIEWDGISASGEAVPSGAYFYRLETSRGTAQGQIRIAR
jgi:hypothetical protein